MAYGTLCYVLLLFAFTTCSADSGNIRQKLRHYIQHLVDCKNLTGLAVAVVKGNETIYQGGFGYQTLDSKKPVTEKTLFNIGSNSKAFTATLAAFAVGDGKLSWDQPLREIFGKDFRLQGEFRTAEASIRDLLSHKLGMPSYWGVSTAVMNFSREEIVKRFQYFPVKYCFRQRFLYSNYPFVLAGAAIEKATGEKWEKAIYNKIYRPLGMTGSRIGATMRDADWSNTAWSYTWINNSYVKNPEKEIIRTVIELGPAAGVFTNAEDMTKWLKFHISGGKDQRGNEIISKSALEETYQAFMPSLDGRTMYRPRYPVDNFNPTYALGWRNGIYSGRPIIFHTGSYSSYASRVTFFPNDDVGIWSAISTDGPFSQYDINRLVTWFSSDLLLGKIPWLNETTACKYPGPWSTERRKRQLHTKRSSFQSQPANSTLRNLTQYLGDYFHPGFGKVTVFLDENKQLKFRFGLFLRGLLLSTSTADKFNQRLDFPLVFRLRPKGYDFFFLRDKKGLVVGTKVPYLESMLPPVFYKNGFGPTSDSPTTITPRCKTRASTSVHHRPCFVAVLIMISFNLCL